MLILCVGPQGCERVDLANANAQPCPKGYLWIDVERETLLSATAQFQETVGRLCGARIHDLHMQDAVNEQHPSSFDSTTDYDILVFRKLVPGLGEPLSEMPGPATDTPARQTPKRLPRLHAITTQPITFFLFERALVTVRNGPSKTIGAFQTRLLQPQRKAPTTAEPLHSDTPHADKLRLPAHPDELALRLLSGLVDRYLEMRQPLTDRIDRWQRDLLNPAVPFSRWSALLDARIELRRLENLCEEQYDALQVLRDHYTEDSAASTHTEALLIRITDVMEHVQRVLSHARRLEASAESAVQLHFSATAHRTNDVVRTLTAITAVFAPLSLVTGIFGMNFAHMPLTQSATGFWIILSVMGAFSTALVSIFLLRHQLAALLPKRLRRRWQPPRH
ncbi:MAG TPA: magnesium transporter CorA family protein [Burkholderiaceae bacterium]|nr:magnesium transporter CorA family protein [Burkholderiaceae bacterium]